MKECLLTECTHLVLARLHITRLQDHLYKKEEKYKNKKKEKLMRDGLPWLLTHPRFFNTVKDHEEAKEAKKVDKEARKVAWMEQVKAKKWEEEVAKIT